MSPTHPCTTLTARPGGGTRPGIVATLATVLLLGACSTGATSTDAASTNAASTRGTSTTSASTNNPAASDLTGTVTVLAAASLTESFDQIASEYRAAHPDVTLEVSYGSSATLVQQVNNGAPASVIALAGTAAAEPLDAALVKSTSAFATNSLEVVVPATNPGNVATLADLARTDLKVVLCADTVPCGKAAAQTFAKAGVTPHVVSKEVDVKATLAKVTLGEADAAVVYHSDVVAAGDAVRGITIDPRVNTSLTYPIIALTEDPAALAFIEQVRSPQGQKALTDHGLTLP